MESGSEVGRDSAIKARIEAQARPITYDEYWGRAESEGKIAVNQGHMQEIERALRESGKAFFQGLTVSIIGEDVPFALISPQEYVALMEHIPKETALSVLYEEIGTPFTSYKGNVQLRARYDGKELNDITRERVQALDESIIREEHHCTSQCRAIEGTLDAIAKQYQGINLQRVREHLVEYRAMLPAQIDPRPILGRG